MLTVDMFFHSDLILGILHFVAALELCPSPVVDNKSTPIHECC